MTILFLGTFDLGYGRNRVITKGLNENGVKVVYCNGGQKGGIAKYFRLIRGYFNIRHENFNAVIVAFPAQEAIFLTRILLLFRRLRHKTPIIIDMLTSHYDGYILDRKKYSPRSFHAKWYRWIDRTAVALADMALVDSESSGRFLVQEIGIPAAKIITVYIGTDDSVMRPVATPYDKKGQFVVHFHGNFIPLQGPEFIIRAANLLKDETVHFQIIGRGQEYARCRQIADNLGANNITWIDHVAYETLPTYFAKADVCLGTFGGTGKFNRCAPNKIYEYMACGKAIVTGRSEALEFIAKDGTNMLLCNPADPEDLAKKIMIFKNDPELISRIGARALTDFSAHYSPKQLMRKLLEDLGNI